MAYEYVHRRIHRSIEVMVAIEHLRLKGKEHVISRNVEQLTMWNPDQHLKRLLKRGFIRWNTVKVSYELTEYGREYLYSSELRPLELI